MTKKILVALLSVAGAAVSAGAGQVYTDAQGNVNLSTVTMQDLCVNDATATRCNTLVGGVNHSGRVGVKTQNPASELDVNGTLTVSSVVVEGTMTLAGAVTAGDLTSTGTVKASTLTVDTNVLTTRDGKVGVGTASPDYTEHVAGGEYVEGQSIVGGTLTVRGNAFSVGTSTLAVSAGRVGIGTASPGSKLHMSSGTLSIDGTAANISITNNQTTEPVGLNGFIRVGRGQAIVTRNAANSGDHILLGANLSLTDDTALGDGDFRTVLLGNGVYIAGSNNNPGGEAFIYFKNATASNPAIRTQGTTLKIVTGDNVSDASMSASSASFSGSVTMSSATFVGVYTSTQAAGGAGAAVTATCSTAGTFAIGGGCDCSGAVGETADVNRPNCTTQGCIANGWTCQISGGTGGACAAFAVCSRLQ